jgi:LAO/AO transport system kinase
MNKKPLWLANNRGKSGQHHMSKALTSNEQAMSTENLAKQTKPACQDELNDLIVRAIALEKWPVARLVSMFEAEPARPSEAAKAADKRLAILSRLTELAPYKQALVIGITGTPGAGKSSLISELCMQLRDAEPELSIAVVAVDPSSQQSGGALLGDRTRVRFPTNDKRLFFRSQANHLDLGGLGKKTFHAVRLLRRLFDIVIIETVGIGQSELEIDQLSDITCLVLQPLTGDQVQFMKAGIMEVPDIFIVNKCDEDELAQKSYHLLKSSLKLISVSVDKHVAEAKPVFLTSALKQKGISQLARYILKQSKDPDIYKDPVIQENFYLKKWIRENYGNYGIEIYQRKMSASFIRNTVGQATRCQSDKSYEQSEAEFNKLIRSMIRPLDDA